MAICPRCGAANLPGRSSCWSCWSPMASPEPPEKQTPPADESAPDTAKTKPAASASRRRRPPKDSASAPVAAESAPVPAASPADQAPVPAPPPPAAPPAPMAAHREPPPDTSAVPVVPRPLEQPDVPEDPTPSLPEICLPEYEAPIPDEFEVETVTEPGKQFVYIAGPAVRAERHASIWLILLAMLLTLVLVAGMLYWWRTFRPPPAATTVTQVADDYLNAMTFGDTLAQDQLATEDSKGALLPGWFVIASGSVNGTVQHAGHAASVPVVLVLAPTPGEPITDRRMVTALSRPYHLTLELKEEPQGWRVDQTAFFHALQQELVKENPNLKFPVWK